MRKRSAPLWTHAASSSGEDIPLRTKEFDLLARLAEAVGTAATARPALRHRSPARGQRPRARRRHRPRCRARRRGGRRHQHGVRRGRTHRGRRQGTRSRPGVEVPLVDQPAHGPAVGRHDRSGTGGGRHGVAARPADGRPPRPPAGGPVHRGRDPRRRRLHGSHHQIRCAGDRLGRRLTRHHGTTHRRHAGTRILRQRLPPTVHPAGGSPAPTGGRTGLPADPRPAIRPASRPPTVSKGRSTTRSPSPGTPPHPRSPTWTSC